MWRFSLARYVSTTLKRLKTNIVCESVCRWTDVNSSKIQVYVRIQTCFWETIFSQSLFLFFFHSELYWMQVVDSWQPYDNFILKFFQWYLLNDVLVKFDILVRQCPNECPWCLRVLNFGRLTSCQWNCWLPIWKLRDDHIIKLKKALVCGISRVVNV